jgi:hypothetical protein
MLIVETAAPAGDGADPAMWVVSPAACGRLALEAVVNETRFDLLAIGPAERILTLLEALAAPAKVNA